jgi:hypothetical protein
MNTMEHNSRLELTDHQWKLIEPLLPKEKKEVGPWPTLGKQNEIVFVLKTGYSSFLHKKRWSVSALSSRF